MFSVINLHTQFFLSNGKQMNEKCYLKKEKEKKRWKQMKFHHIL